jgi:ornithine carbamoyltransferase
MHMRRGLKGRDFLTVNDFSKNELQEILDLALQLKKERREGREHPVLRGKTLGMIFQKASTRTRVSFEVGMYQLGGQGLFLSGSDMQIGRGEPIKDTARVLSRYLDGIMIRTFNHQEVEELAHYADIPVINGLTDLLHPCQAMADLMTILERKGKLAGLSLGYVGDGNNMAHSLMLACSKMGMNVVVATPSGYEVDPEVAFQSQRNAASNRCRVILTRNPELAVSGADVVYTDVWASMGQEAEHKARIKAFQGFQINSALLHSAPQAMVLHCLPAHRDEEITDEVLEGPQSAVFDQAENRLHVQKAIMATLM